MRSIVYIRNLCAHHSHFWNLVMSIQPICTISASKPWLNNNTIQIIKHIIQYQWCCIYCKPLIQKILFQKISKLIKKNLNVDARAMGFPF